MKAISLPAKPYWWMAEGPCINPYRDAKLETLNSKQAQTSLLTGGQAKHKTQNRKSK
jgi:hypothetical protein